MHWTDMQYGRLMIFVGVVVSSFLACVVPVATIPKGSGPYNVARTHVAVHETQDGDPGFNASIYYPTTCRNEDYQAPYLRQGQRAANAFGGVMHLPSFVMSHLTLLTPPLLDDR